MRHNKTSAKKWILAKWESLGLYITPDGEYFTKEGIKLVREYKAGSCYRAPGSNKRFYYAKLNKNKVLINKVIKWASEPNDPKD